MSLLDKMVAAVTPLESDDERAVARHNARQIAVPGDWLSMVLDHHQQIEAAFERTRVVPPHDRRAAQKALTILLTGHSNAEESVLYPAMTDHGEKGAVAMAFEEQAMAKVQLAKLEKMDPGSREYLDKLEHLEGAVLHHIYQEESHWLPELRNAGTSAEHELLTARYAEEMARYSDAPANDLSSGSRAMDKKNDPLDHAAGDDRHTPAGAPTDAAHEAVGDGTLQGSVPAGLTPDELMKIARSDRTDDAGTG
jgi:hypothetical protein